MGQELESKTRSFDQPTQTFVHSSEIMQVYAFFKALNLNRESDTGQFRSRIKAQ